MDLHIGYESVRAWPLERIDIPMDRGEPVAVGSSKSLLVAAALHHASANVKADAPKALLKADKIGGRLILDSQTTLAGVPASAWDYMLGNRCALEWVLDQYKKKTPKDPTIRERFNTYRFADYKEKAIDLLMRVTTVSVETQRIADAMRSVPRD
jgi:predicted helicase